MDLTHINSSLYPRAVTASAEGRMRPERTAQRGGERAQLHAEAASTTSGQRASRRESMARQYQVQQADQWPGEGTGAHGPNEADLPGHGERLAATSRRARQDHARHRFSMPALVSARGREANRRYLETSMASQPRIIDEVV